MCSSQLFLHMRRDARNCLAFIRRSKKANSPQKLSARRSARTILLITGFFLTSPFSFAQIIGNHPAVYDARGILLSWKSWRDALDLEVNWYLKCPVENGYPRFVYMTFMDGRYRLIEKRPSLIPATQNGMGIISYLKWHEFAGRKDPRLVRMARYMGDYLVKEALTPETGKYPRFSRSTGWSGKFPQPA